MKFCGFKTIEEVEFASTLPIQAIGFILVPNRKRTVSLEQLAYLLPIIPDSIWRVGVFQNPSLEEVGNAVSLGLSMVQLHGQESPAFCKQVKESWQIPIIKVFSETQLQEIPSYKDVMDIVLLDHASGGKGELIDWSYIPQAKRVTESLHLPLWIAGGLNESNIDNLYSNYELDGVDLSSGIESNGRKDNQKMIKLVERMKKHDKVEW
ncbi:phosphoribosylanthranilate isomerase [Shimazuella sp. AN120528]|uniref:phosphoribosylanthranilate isomerase n=1 Tax=Shimazuella soli TaxID=1892854 RepID=UPI001F0FDE15|nr:phosphoribosylanthranilate isomerase [Shimazuella soli]MCH5585450.1 phosphoribosylanthranilate isomerase [Shimazuella soli]